MKLPAEPPFDDSQIERETRPWDAQPGATYEPGQSLCWVWLKVLAAGFLLALVVGWIGFVLDGLGS